MIGMRTDTAKTIRLSDYQPPEWLIDTVDLDVSLHPTKTKVRATLRLRPNSGTPAPLVLDGEDVTLTGLAIDGEPVAPERYSATKDKLTIPQPPQGAFSLTIDTEIDPTANLQLSGLYRSSNNYCTQCEAEGFRRITYFLDRPDVMAVYTTRIEADKAEAPVLLANGNLTDSGDLPGGRHFAVWHDPFQKPRYLFALGGGTLGVGEDSFINQSGAVSDFNMGAMENKGLNVFNDKLVLASPQSATDADYAAIEAVIAHEYFHNWTGNRITCRDWFQLCLKEGLTVFRDQEFSSDERSRPVKRVADVRALRATQFVEDAGPLSHPVRPTQYKEINNFYTTTVYEKGAEVVRMIKTLIGDKAFRAGMDLYFERHDGEAATIEQFVQCFADVSKRDMTQFMRWYSQAGTPDVIASGTHDPVTQTYRLEIGQSVPSTPGQLAKEPMLIPLAFGLIGQDGRRGPFAGTRGRPVRPINRGFSAPVKPTATLSTDDLRFLAASDSDSFNRWQAVRSLATRALMETITRLPAGGATRPQPALIEALAAVLADETLEPAFVALMLTPPSETDIAREIGRNIDPDAIYAARKALRVMIGKQLDTALPAAYKRITSTA